MRRSRACWLFGALLGMAASVAAQSPAQLPRALAGAAPPVASTPIAPATPQPAAVVAPAAPVALTLDHAVHACLANDPRLRAALENVSQATADYVTATLPPNPTFNIDRQLNPLTRPFTKEMTGGPPQFDSGLSWRIDWFLFGKRAAEMAVRSYGIKVAESDYADAVRQRVADVTQAFYGALEARELLRIARQDVQNLERVESVLMKGVAAGGKPRVELSRVQLDLFNSRRALREAELALATAKVRLRAFLGRADSDLTFDVAGSLEVALTGEVLPADQSFALAEQSRPDLESRRGRVAQAEADVVNQHRKAYPEVTPNLWYTRQYQVKSVGVPNADSWNAALSVTLPVFDRNQGDRLKASSEVAQSRYELQAALVDLRAEIEAVLQELLTARANAELLTGAQLRLAAEVRDNITRAYQAGGRTLLEVLDANRTYNETFRASITTRANYWRALYRYYSVIGRQVTKHDARHAERPHDAPQLPAPRPR